MLANWSSDVLIAKAHAVDYIALLQEWDRKRRSTLNSIRLVAREVYRIGVDVFATRVGDTMGYTKIRTSHEILDYTSGESVQEAQISLNEEKELLTKLGIRRQKLNDFVKDVSRGMSAPVESTLNTLLITALSQYRYRKGNFTLTHLTNLLKSGCHTLGPDLEGLVKTFDDVSVEGITRLAGQLLRGVPVDSMLVWNLEKLINTALEKNYDNGELDAARALETLDKHMTTQLDVVEKYFKDVRRAEHIKLVIQDQQYTQNAQFLAVEYIGLFSVWSAQRKSTLGELKVVAEKLRALDSSCMVIKDVGRILPLVHREANQIHEYLSSPMFKHTLLVIHAEKSVAAEIDDTRATLDVVVRKLSQHTKYPIDDILNTLLVTAIEQNVHRDVGLPDFQSLIKSGNLRNVPTDGGVARTFDGVTVEGIAEIARGEVRTVSAASDIFIWDIEQLIQTEMQGRYDDRGEMFAATELERMTKRLSNQLDDVEKCLQRTGQREGNMLARQTNDSDLVEAQTAAKAYVQLLINWIPKRNDTITQIEKIATDIDAIKTEAKKGELAGTATAVIGGAATVGAILFTILTGGAGVMMEVPLAIGVGGSIAGTTAGVASGLAGDYKSNEKVKEAQAVLDREKQIVQDLETQKLKLDTLVKQISTERNIRETDVLNTLLATAVFNDGRPSSKMVSFPTLVKLMQPATKVLITRTLLTTLEPLTTGMSNTFAGVSIEGIGKLAGAAFRGVAGAVAGVLLMWDVYQLVQTSIDLSKGTPSETALALREIANNLTAQRVEVEDQLEAIRKTVEDFEESTKEKFRRLLTDISRQGDATEDDVERVKEYIMYHASDQWKQMFLDTLNLDNYAFPLSRIAHNLLELVRKYLQDKGNEEEINVIIVSHGNIDTDASRSLPCLFYYMMPNLTSITLYEPWGCAIDATVVHGILTNTIAIENVRCSGQVHPDTPSGWNVLPRGMIMIPTTKLSPVSVGETAYRHLTSLFLQYTARSQGLVIPYFTGLGDQDILPYPDVPLWVFSNAVSLLGHFCGKRVAIKVAACLSVEDPSHESGFVNSTQYAVVDGTCVPPVSMTNNAQIPTEIFAGLNMLNDVL